MRTFLKYMLVVFAVLVGFALFTLWKNGAFDW